METNTGKVRELYKSENVGTKIVFRILIIPRSSLSTKFNGLNQGHRKETGYFASRVSILLVLL